MAKSIENKSINILDEDTFVDEVGKIIERDFFPDMPELRSQLSGEPSRGSFRTPQTTPVRTPGKTPRTTPRRTPGRRDIIQRPSSNLSLNQFLDSYTSEDNFNIFTKIKQDTEKSYKSKYKWLAEQQKALKDSRMNALMFNPPGLGLKKQAPNRLGIQYKNCRTIKNFGEEVKVTVVKGVSKAEYLTIGTPTPRPDNMTPLITWGEIKSTPLQITKPNDTPSLFRTPDPSTSTK